MAFARKQLLVDVACGTGLLSPSEHAANMTSLFSSHAPFTGRVRRAWKLFCIMPRPEVGPPTKAALRAAAQPASSPAPRPAPPRAAAVTVHGGDGYSLCIECGQSTIEGLYKEYSKDNIRLSRCVRGTWSFIVSSPLPCLYLPVSSFPHAKVMTTTHSSRTNAAP